MSEPAGKRSADHMSFLDHLGELRTRLLYSAGAVLVAAFVCMGFAPQLFDWLRRPLLSVSGQKLIVLSPLEMFLTYMKLAILAGVFVAAPWVLYQVWMFISPGLYRHEKRWILPFVVLGSLFFMAGGAFAFYVVLPIGFKYLVAMAPEYVETQYSVGMYFSFIMHLLLAFGLVFELPLVMWILAAAGIVAPRTWSRFRKYWIVLAFVIGGVLTPPDPITQILMAVPLLLFFEMGVAGARLLYRKPAAA